jgi:hypothetical protein
MGSGGGSSGGVAGTAEFPTYVKDHHHWALQRLMNLQEDGIDCETNVNLIGRTADANPYVTGTYDGPGSGTPVQAYDPAPLLDQLNENIAELIEQARFFDVSSNVKTDARFVRKLADNEIFGDEGIEESVSAFSGLQEAELAKAVTRFSSAMSDVGAVMSSAYAAGVAILNDGHVKTVAQFHADARREGRARRDAFVSQAVMDMARLRIQQFDISRAALGVMADATKVEIVAFTEQIKDQTTFHAEAARWEIEQYRYGANMLASSVGGVESKHGQGVTNKGMNALSGALGGAATGFMVGGPWGAVAGAGIGAAGGMMQK